MCEYIYMNIYIYICVCVCIIIYTNNTFKIKITMNKCYSLEVPGKRIIQLNNLKIEKVAT